MFIEFTFKPYFKYTYSSFNELLFENTVDVDVDNELNIPNEYKENLDMLNKERIEILKFELDNEMCISKIENAKTNYLKYISCKELEQINFQTFIYTKNGKYNMTFDEYPILDKFPVKLFNSLNKLTRVKRLIIANIKFNNLEEELYNTNSDFIKMISNMKKLNYINFYRTNVDIEKLKEFVPNSISLDNSLDYVN